MSIASEIQRLQQAKASIKTSVWWKWVTIPDNIKLDDYWTYIDCIKTTDYSCWTTAYWLKATTSLIWYWNWWLCLQYSEITDDWTVSWIFSSRWWCWSSSCDAMQMYFLWKKLWCMPSWNSVNCTISGQRSETNFWVYAHCTNPDCFLINRSYCWRYSWSWWRWTWACYYYRVWIDFSVPCMSCLMSWSWCQSWDCCWSLDCDNNPPWADYKYLWRSISLIAACRWNKPAWILCTTIESSDSNRYVWAAVFR